MKINIFKSVKDGQWYFHIVARNGEIVAQSEGYKRRQSAIDTVDAILKGVQENGFQIVTQASR